MQRWLRYLPNFISSLRICLVVPIGWVLWQQQFIVTLWLFLIAAVSDAVDGYLARRFSWQSELGGMLDPVADKLMLATVFVVLAMLGAVPLWLTAAVLARDGIIVLGAISYRLLLGPVRARPTFISKLNTLCQIAFVLLMIARLQFAWPSAALLIGLGAAVFTTVVISGIDYVLVYGRMAAGGFKARHAAPRTGGTTGI